MIWSNWRRRHVAVNNGNEHKWNMCLTFGTCWAYCICRIALLTYRRFNWRIQQRNDSHTKLFDNIIHTTQYTCNSNKQHDKTSIHASIIFIHSFIHSFIHLFIHSFIHSFIYSFIHSKPSQLASSLYVVCLSAVCLSCMSFDITCTCLYVCVCV